MALRMAQGFGAEGTPTLGDVDQGVPDFDLSCPQLPGGREGCLNFHKSICQIRRSRGGGCYGSNCRAVQPPKERPVVESKEEKKVEMNKDEAGTSKKKTINKKRVALCACGCGKSGAIIGRGLVGGCYNRLQKSGELEKFSKRGNFPGKSGPVAKVVAPADDPPTLDVLIAEPDEFAPPPRVFTALEIMGEPDDPDPPRSERQGRLSFTEHLDAVLADVRDMLLAKNAAYGDSALNPLRVFSKADPVEQINVRLDDKLSRLLRGEAAGEDTEFDLVGDLVIKRIAQRRQGGEQ